MEEKKIEEYTPEEIAAIRKKDRFYNKARRAVAITMLSLFGAAFVFLAGTMVTGITHGVLTDKQTALLDELCNSSAEYNELYSKQVDSLRSNLVNNKIIDEEYIQSVDKLNSKEHKRKVLFTLNDVDLTEYNERQAKLDNVIKAREVFTSISLGSAAMTFPFCVLGDRI